ncbi:bifunctional methylenetetrahydrofolate dehydrogenase/methenyltetrahydrofolate cyclohydrolase FolD [bacterium]|nr:bifunctional methylenetetrahydrofolate dehydrogenase/methenyltetrahydrofolate cyclohydrolase FolD [bacterium]
MANLIDGKAIAEQITNEVRAEVGELSKKGIIPGLAVVLVGENPASKVYVRNKQKACEKAGITSIKISYEATVSEKELLEKICELNNKKEVDGILVQLPLPKHIDENKIISAISPLKDVDGFHPENVGKLVLGQKTFLPCTPAGIQQLLIRKEIATAGKHVVVIGRSNIVGKPAAFLFLQKGIGGDATVTIVHSRTKNLAEITKQADILIAAIGVPNFVKAEMVKEEAVVIDVGINRVEIGENESKLVGDVDFENVSKKASFITPVPGGVGPMTIAMLLKNTTEAAKLRV